MARWLYYRGDCKARFDCVNLVGGRGNDFAVYLADYEVFVVEPFYLAVFLHM